MKFPITITTDQDKLKFLYRAVELLRLEHNEKGKTFREGKMTEKEFRDYQNGEFQQKTAKIFAELNPIAEKLGMFQMPLPGTPTYNSNDFRFKLEEDAKKETKWDKDINLTEI